MTFEKFGLSLSLKYLQDLPRTFPGHPWLDTPEGHAALRRVLVAYSFRDSDVGYCQVSLSTVAHVLQHFVSLSYYRNRKDRMCYNYTLHFFFFSVKDTPFSGLPFFPWRVSLPFGGSAGVNHVCLCPSICFSVYDELDHTLFMVSTMWRMSVIWLWQRTRPISWFLLSFTFYRIHYIERVKLRCISPYG